MLRRMTYGTVFAALIAGSSACRPAAQSTSEILRVDSVGDAWVPVGQGRIRVRLQGVGGPTVVLVSGLGDGLEAWRAVQPKIAAITQVLAYDRPGLGASDAQAGARDVPHMTTELRALLQRSRVPAPYILVGHSLGGFIVQYYAAHYPDDVAGMVLVDPAIADFYRSADALPAWREEKAEKLRDLSGASPAIRAEFGAFDADVAAVAAARPLSPIPVVLLTSVHHGLTGPAAESLEVLWLEAQRDWAHAHPGTRHVVDPIHGHYLQVETPEAVVGAVQEVLRRVAEHRPRQAAPSSPRSVSSRDHW